MILNYVRDMTLNVNVDEYHYIMICPYNPDIVYILFIYLKHYFYVFIYLLIMHTQESHGINNYCD